MPREFAEKLSRSIVYILVVQQKSDQEVMIMRFISCPWQHGLFKSFRVVEDAMNSFFDVVNQDDLSSYDVGIPSVTKKSQTETRESKTKLNFSATPDLTLFIEPTVRLAKDVCQILEMV